MQTIAEGASRSMERGPAERSLITWVLLALALLASLTILFESPFPIFTVIWLAVPLLAVVRNSNARAVGWHLVPAAEFFKVTTICLVVMLILAALVEPWSHAYQVLLQLATAGDHPDGTFVWLVRYPGIAGWIAMLIYSGTVTILGEELFFRGWLLQFLLKRTGLNRAVILQALLFTLPQLLPALVMPVEQGIVYAIVYSWLIVGVVTGWAAARTSSIFPGLVSATLLNFILTAVLL